MRNDFLTQRGTARGNKTDRRLRLFKEQIKVFLPIEMKKYKLLFDLNLTSSVDMKRSRANIFSVEFSKKFRIGIVLTQRTHQ